MSPKQAAESEASNEKDRGGIRDWASKFGALKALYGTTRREIAEGVLGDGATEQSIESLTDALRTWHESRPTRTVGPRFVKGLAKRIKEMGSDRELRALENIIVDGSYLDFVSCVPIKHRDGFPDAGLTVNRNDVDYRHIWTNRHAQLETVASGFRTRRIDHRLYYLSPESVAIWDAVIDSDRYRQYGDCKQALRQLVESEFWEKFFERDATDGIVMLGGGTPQKDLLAIRHALLHNKGRTLQYALVDYGWPMLKNTLGFVERSLRRDDLLQRVEIEPIEWDFLDLKGAGVKLVREGKNVCWLIPGGTVGNLNEGALFQSVKSVAHVGDLFVVGADTLHPGEAKAATDVKEKYDIPEVKRFVESPIRSAWHDLKLQGNIEDVLKNVQVDTVPPDRNTFSSVPGATTLEVFMELDDRHITLLTSTRYDADQFVAFARGKGFALDHVVESALAKHFKQFVFRYMGQSGIAG
jgi:hypothetical protein